MDVINYKNVFLRSEIFEVKKYTIQPYSVSDIEIWNAFIVEAKNATFLFDRRFMSYHADRFIDCSLLVFDDKKLVAVLPGNKDDSKFFSHQGLTYGGIVWHKIIKLNNAIAIFEQIILYLSLHNLTKIQFKMTPTFYHECHSQELEYLLFLKNASLIRRDTLAVIEMSKKEVFSKIRNRGIKKGFDNHLVIKEENDFTAFWNTILIPNLSSKYDTKPVHTLAEIQHLKQIFPNNIRQFNVYFEQKLVAGTTIFETKTTAHSQYIAGNELKDELGSLDFLFAHLIQNVFANKRYFDFGISNENNGKILNEGLSYWKESFGAKIWVHDFYELSIQN